MAQNNYAYLGKAVSYPLKISGGAPVIIGGKAVIEASITKLLTTPLGTRKMLPDWGCRIDELRWEPNDKLLETLLRTYITDCIQKWERRIFLLGVDIIIKADMALCRLLYKVLPSNEVDAYVYPFSRKGLPY